MLFVYLWIFCMGFLLIHIKGQLFGFTAEYYGEDCCTMKTFPLTYVFLIDKNETATNLDTSLYIIEDNLTMYFYNGSYYLKAQRSNFKSVNKNISEYAYFNMSNIDFNQMSFIQSPTSDFGFLKIDSKKTFNVICDDLSRLYEPYSDMIFHCTTCVIKEQVFCIRNKINDDFLHFTDNSSNRVNITK